MEKKTIELELVAVRDNVFDLKFPESISTLESSKPATISESQYGDQYRLVTLKKGDELTLLIKLK